MGNPKARRLFQQEFPKEFPMVVGSPMFYMVQNMTLANLLQMSKGHIPQKKIQHILEELKKI
ncbi:hypothetical protein [Candidatus Soleaferrea massiliensis]|uniref:hypothetical protein n=1 Tax=Candidatus Soleaferrea massiliensis TaxID=1470354 RepID=UPI0012E0382A|nr:hypothetical protein [Candidatus Soleaferrea massiliensis]